MGTELEMKTRTKMFSQRAINLAMALPENELGRVIRRQLLRSSTSIAANYRAVCRARSKADFLSKLGIVEEETDESMYWLELIMENALQPEAMVSPLHREADEILSIIVASIKTSRGRSQL